MMENEAIDKLNNLHYKIVHTSFCNKVYESEIEALCIAKDCLKEIQQYRAIGTVEECAELLEYRAIGSVDRIKGSIETNYVLLHTYEAIGTIEEFKALKEKNTPMKHHHTRIDNISDEIRVSVCPNCLSIMYTHSEEYPVFCNVCGQKLDWQ